jgi:hypothetical protein
MALPLIIFGILIFVALLFICISLIGNDAGGKLMFFAAGSIVLMLTGMFLMSDGIQTDASGYTYSADGTSAAKVYSEYTTTNSWPLYVIANFMFFGGLAGIGFATYNIWNERRNAKREETDI